MDFTKQALNHSFLLDLKARPTFATWRKKCQMLIWFVLLRYDVCFFSGDDSMCSAAKEYRFDVGDVDAFERMSFPTVTEMKIELVADILTAVSLGRFWREKPKFIVEGIANRRTWLFDVTLNNEFEFELRNVRVSVSGKGASLKVSSLKLVNCEFETEKLVSSMNFVCDFASLPVLGNVESWNYVFHDFRPLGKYDKKMVLRRKMGFLQSVSFAAMENGTRLCAYGPDVRVSLGECVVYFEMEQPMTVTVNHDHSDHVLAFQSAFARGESSDLVVVAAQKANMAFQHGTWGRKVQVICKGHNAISHGGGYIPMSITGSESLLFRCESEQCQIDAVHLPSGQLNVSASAPTRVVVGDIRADAEATVIAHSSNLTVQIGDVSTSSDSDVLVKFDGAGTFVFERWHHPNVSRVVRNLRIESPLVKEDCIHFTLAKVPLTNVTGKLETPANGILPIQLLGDALPKEDEVEKYMGQEHDFLCASEIEKDLELGFAHTGGRRGFGRGISIYESRTDTCLKLVMKHHIASVNNVFCLGNGPLCPKNATVFLSADEASTWRRFLDVKAVESVSFYVYDMFHGFVLDFEGFGGEIRIIGMSQKHTDITCKPNIFMANAVVLENLNLFLEDPGTWNGRVHGNLSLIRATVSQDAASKLIFNANNTLKTNCNEAQSITHELPNVELFDLDYSDIAYGSDRYVFHLNGTNICTIQTPNRLTVHTGSTHVQSVTGLSPGVLEISELAPSTVMVNGTNSTRLRFGSHNGKVVTLSEAVQIDTFGHSRSILFESPAHSDIVWDMHHLNNTFQISDTLKTLRFRSLVVAPPGKFVHSNATEIIIDNLHLPERSAFPAQNLTISEAIHLSPGAQLTIDSLTIPNDISVFISFTGHIPYCSLVGDLNHKIHVSVTQTEPLVFLPETPIRIACLPNHTDIDITTSLLSSAICVTRRNNCVVIEPSSSARRVHTWIIVVSTLASLALLIFIIIMIIKRRRRQPAHEDTALFAPLEPSEFSTEQD